VPRKRRNWSPPHFYHVVSRGNRRDPLFQDEKDVAAFISILTKIHEKTAFEIASYCFMTNHFHLQIRSQEVDMSKVMAMINRRYAGYYNTRYCVTGHAYEDRFFAEIVPGAIGNITLSHYIHLNPVRANMVSEPQEYGWSSFQYFQTLSLSYPPFFSPLHILDYYEGSLEEKQSRYFDSLQQYIQKYLVIGT
jgi:putative transposase